MNSFRSMTTRSLSLEYVAMEEGGFDGSPFAGVIGVHWYPSYQARPACVPAQIDPFGVSTTATMRFEGKPDSVVNSAHRQG
jgi:hypothetical protein